MDKNPAQLDPKLKEAYDRVMGTVITPKQTAEPQKIENQPQQAPQATQQPQPAKAQATPPTLIPKPTSEFVRKKKGISPLILILLVFVFLIVYAYVWTMIFNVKLF